MHFPEARAGQIAGASDAKSHEASSSRHSRDVIRPACQARSKSAGVGQVGLTWNASSGAASYTVKRSTTAGGPYTPIGPVLTVTNYTDSAVTAGTKYYYVVTASNTGGESGNSNEASATPTPGGSGASAVFLNLDTATRGTWKGVYGADGYNISQLSSSIPAYAQLSFTGTGGYTWAASTTDVRALQKVSTSDRIAACWYGTLFYANVNLTDGQAHQIALYMLDWDSGNVRAATVDVLDASNNAVLNSQPISSYGSGKWLVWSVTGNVKFRITKTGGSNAVLSGIFFK